MNFKIVKSALAGLVLSASSIANAGVIFYDDFSDNSENWSLGTTWEIGSATASTGQFEDNGDPALDHSSNSNNGVAGVVIGGDVPVFIDENAPKTHDFYYLTSRAIDTTLYASNLNFEFYRWLNSDFTPFMENKIDVFDGNVWVNLWLSGESPAIQDNAWTRQTFDISSYTSDNLQIRIGYNITDASVFSVSSWNVDDVKIYSSIPAPVEVPEPSTLAIFSLAIFGFVARKINKKA